MANQPFLHHDLNFLYSRNVLFEKNLLPLHRFLDYNARIVSIRVVVNCAFLVIRRAILEGTKAFLKRLYINNNNN